MEENNDLSGLASNGFQNSNDKFNSEIFKDNKTIELLRPIIKKYLSKTKNITIKTCTCSCKLKHDAKDYIDKTVYSGEFIYAMHLEGYKIKRHIGYTDCYFNVSTVDSRLFRDTNNLRKTLSQQINPNVFRLLKFEKQFLKYKYHFNYLLHEKFTNTRKKNDAVKIISKEMNENVVNIKYWFDILKGQDSTIPEEKMEQLERLFNLDTTTLTNNIENSAT